MSKIVNNYYRGIVTLNPHISGLEGAFDKIPKPKIIYWEGDISLEGQNNSIS